jgi:hypothetical protein
MGDPPEEGSFMWGGKAEVAKRPVITSNARITPEGSSVLRR